MRRRQHTARRDDAASTPRRRVARRGLTLVELTIAIAVIGVLMSAAVMGLGAITGAQAKGAAGELSGVIRSLYDTAALSGRTCRLVFALPGERDADGEVSYRAECAAGAVTTNRDRERALELEARAAEDRQDDDRFSLRSGSDEPSLEEVLAREEERVARATEFSEYTSPEIAPRTLPSSVEVAVWTRGMRRKITSGLAQLYFFPQGSTERAMIFITQGDDTWTIRVSPLTGKTEIVGEELEVPSR